MTNVIDLDQVVKRFDGTPVLDGLSLSVAPNTIFGLLGPSGSGKTTAIRLMIGVHRPTSGTIEVLGLPPVRWTTKVRESVGYMPQLSFLYPSLSVMESVNFSASIYGLGWLSRRPRIRRLLEVVELWDERRKLVSQLSGGMRKRLSLACALVHDPRLVFLDEPTTGIDPILRERFWDFFRDLRDEGKCMVVTSHYVAEAEYCDQVGVLDDGRLVALGTPLELRRAALGGDAVDVVTRGLTVSQLDQIKRLPGVRGVETLSLTTARVYVAEAGSAVPRLLEEIRAQGIEVEAVREYHPSFDEVFSRLVRKAA